MATDGIKQPINLNEVTGYNKAQSGKPKKNPNELDNDAFMKLFLEQLKNQDPTSPMETDKIITQTAQLTQVEMQEQTKQTMIEVADAMKSTQATNEELRSFQNDMKTTLEALLASINKNSESSVDNNSNVLTSSPYNSINMIGKIVETKVNGLNVEEGKDIDFELYFDENIDISKGRPTIMIFNENKELVREFDISAYNGMGGYLRFSWDSRDSLGNALPSGAYNVIANYNQNLDGNFNVARLGRGEIQSVIFSDGKPHLRLGELIVPLEDALEFYAKKQ